MKSEVEIKQRMDELTKESYDLYMRRVHVTSKIIRVQAEILGWVLGQGEEVSKLTISDVPNSLPVPEPDVGVVQNG